MPLIDKSILYKNRLPAERAERDRESPFIGRDEETAAILDPFLDKTPVLIKGQAGVGKTAMAGYLVQHLIDLKPNAVPIVFDETTKTIEDIIDAMQQFLIAEGQAGVVSELAAVSKGMEKFTFLASKVSESFLPVFVFDNLETFQPEPGAKISDQFADLREVISFLCKEDIYHLILICRCPVPGFDNLKVLDLKPATLTDFHEKCSTLEFSQNESIKTYLTEDGAAQKNGTFRDTVQLLHQTFDGNYRALELFSQLIRHHPDKMGQLVAPHGTMKQEMGQNLFFGQLMALLNAEEQNLLRLLSRFRIPVELTALEMQGCDSTVLEGMLEKLQNLTLIDVSVNPRFEVIFFYVTPFVKDLLEVFEKNENETSASFSHPQAAEYYLHRYYNMEGGLILLAEAFFHFDQAGDMENFEKIGSRISNCYYKYSMTKNAFYYSGRVNKRLGDQSEAWFFKKAMSDKNYENNYEANFEDEFKGNYKGKE